MHAVMGQVAVVTEGKIDLDAGRASRVDLAMERYACGDEAAFVEIYDALAPRLYRFALRWTRNRSAAEDTVQQALLQIHAARDRFLPGSAVIPWAYAIARRLLIDLGRRGVREELRADDARDGEEASTALSADESLHRKRMEAAARGDLALLPLRWREAFELVKFEGLPVTEAADVLGITPAMVKIRTHRATAALREAMARRLRHPQDRTIRAIRCAPRPDDISKGGLSK